MNIYLENWVYIVFLIGIMVSGFYLGYYIHYLIQKSTLNNKSLIEILTQSGGSAIAPIVSQFVVQDPALSLLCYAVYWIGMFLALIFHLLEKRQCEKERQTRLIQYQQKCM